MTKKDQIHEKWSKLGRVSHFECLARASEYFYVLANDWNLLRTSRGRKYLLTKKIARLTQNKESPYMSPLSPRPLQYENLIETLKLL